MTIWDKIHKSGSLWGSLSQDIHPLFKNFLEQNRFKTKHTLDIGCGTGKYLALLKQVGFKTDGIDSSKTAVTQAKKLLGKNSNIRCVDMFKFEIPKNRYDLIISISASHHGAKKQIRGLINQIRRALINEGKLFITLPDLKSSKKWETFKDSIEIGPGTFKPTIGPEKGLLHSFYSKEEIKHLFSKFKKSKFYLDERGRWIIEAEK